MNNSYEDIYTWKEPCCSCAQEIETRYTCYGSVFKCLDCDLEDAKEELKRLEKLRDET